MSYIILLLQYHYLCRYMRFSPRKISVAILAAVLGAYLLMPKADAAGLCAGAMCLHCNERIFSVTESTSKVGLDDHLCEVSLGNVPCNLDIHSNLNAPVIITSSASSYRHVSGIFFVVAGYNPSLSHNAGGSGRAVRFPMASGSIPIYLQNLSLLC
jgi:hypothetical protein